MEAVAFDDDCLRVRLEVSLNDLSLAGAGAPISVQKSQRPFSIGSQVGDPKTNLVKPPFRPAASEER